MSKKKPDEYVETIEKEVLNRKGKPTFKKFRINKIKDGVKQVEEKKEVSVKPSEAKNLEFENGIFGKRLKVTYPPKQKHHSPYFDDGNLQILIVGKSGSGKSTILNDIVNNIGGINRVCYFSKITGNTIQSVLKDICDNKGYEFYFADDINEARNMIDELMEKLKDKPNEWSFLIFDDFQTGKKSRNGDNDVFIAQCSMFMRNFNCHIAMVCQNPISADTLLRNNVNIRIVFDLKNIYAIRSIREDVINSSDIKHEDFDRLMKEIKKVPHSFLLQSNNGHVYVNIPGKTDGLEIVDGEQDKGSQVEDDETLKQLCQNCVNNKGKLLHEEKAKKQLQEYLDYLCNKGVDVQTLRDVCKKFDLLI